MIRRALLALTFFSLLMTTLDLRLFGNQHRFVLSEAHDAAMVGGIGSGKTQGGAVRALLAAYGRIGRISIPAPNLGIVTAPTYPMLADSTLRTFREVAGDLVDVKSSAFSAPMHVLLRNGSEIIFRSADKPEHLRGPSASWSWDDEAALHGKLVRDIAIGRLRQFGRHGYNWLTTTPKGRNWIWQKFVERPLPGSEIFRVRTRDNPFLDEGFIQSLEQEYQGDFARQELLGEFVAFEGLIYPEFSRDLHVAQTGQIPRDFKEMIAGVDWGFVNPGVIKVLGVTSDKRAYVVHEEYQRKRGIDEWVNVAVQLRDIWHIGDFYCDPSEPDYIDKFKAKGLKARAADNTVTTGIQAVKRRLAVRADGLPGLLYYPGAMWSFSEYEQYQWARKGEDLLDKPLKANDHALDAIRYAIMGLDEPDLVALSVEVRRYA